MPNRKRESAPKPNIFNPDIYSPHSKPQQDAAGSNPQQAGSHYYYHRGGISHHASSPPQAGNSHDVYSSQHAQTQNRLFRLTRAKKHHNK